ncbi:Uncharacterised protein [Mycobacteroides abscessus subsp. massiliense]|nr:Uncharacterised protein [Mycobacteroides abscessus subsp. massiliense]SLC56453.1 Uncharacterised protein [Mycobacteroides abscessus subsp. massiliense]
MTTRKLLVPSIATIATAAAIALASPALADPDPFVPDGNADWCPGGEHPGYGGVRYCLGESFADGSFYAQTWSLGPSGPFGPGAWRSGAMCSVWVEGRIQGGLPGGGLPGCDGRPRFVD